MRELLPLSRFVCFVTIGSDRSIHNTAQADQAPPPTGRAHHMGGQLIRVWRRVSARHGFARSKSFLQPHAFSAGLRHASLAAFTPASCTRELARPCHMPHALRPAPTHMGSLLRGDATRESARSSSPPAQSTCRVSAQRRELGNEPTIYVRDCDKHVTRNQFCNS